MNASSSASVGTFLQDVIGRDQTLEPSCGRLRLIHARILTEVETTKVLDTPEQLRDFLTY